MRVIAIRLLQIGMLFVLYFIGVWIQELFNLIIPGSVIGLVLLFVLLVTNVIKLKWIEEGASFLMKHLALFFIPATVGIMKYYDVFLGKGIWLVITTIISTMLVIVISGHVSAALEKKRGKMYE